MKKQDVVDLINRYSRPGLESCNFQFYVIKNIEYASKSILNTVFPSDKYLRAIAAPIPLLAPVITTVIFIFSLFFGMYYSYSNYNSTIRDRYNSTSTRLNLSDDVARLKLGSKWRIPTAMEIKELMECCNWAKTTINGVIGWKVSSKKNSSKYIFLPLAGEKTENGYNHVNQYGNYWSCDINTSNSDNNTYKDAYLYQTRIL